MRGKNYCIPACKIDTVLVLMLSETEFGVRNKMLRDIGNRKMHQKEVNPKDI